MLDSGGIAGKGLLKKESIVELLKFGREKDNLFADFPIGATIQDGGKRKRAIVLIIMSGKNVIIIILEDIYMEIISKWYINSVVKKEKTIWIHRPLAICGNMFCSN